MRRKPGGPHPLLAEVIRALPAAPPFRRPEREAWLQMITVALDVAYGSADVAAGSTAATSASPAADGVSAPPTRKPPYRFRVDAEGYARGPNGNEIMAQEIPAGETLWDLRGADAADLSTVIWRDGVWPASALQAMGVAVDLRAPAPVEQPT
jgi:hypothetical protein